MNKSSHFKSVRYLACAPNVEQLGASMLVEYICARRFGCTVVNCSRLKKWLGNLVHRWPNSGADPWAEHGTQLCAKASGRVVLGQCNCGALLPQRCGSAAGHCGTTTEWSSAWGQGSNFSYWHLNTYFPLSSYFHLGQLAFVSGSGI